MTSVQRLCILRDDVLEEANRKFTSAFEGTAFDALQSFFNNPACLDHSDKDGPPSLKRQRLSPTEDDNAVSPSRQIPIARVTLRFAQRENIHELDGTTADAPAAVVEDSVEVGLINVSRLVKDQPQRHSYLVRNHQWPTQLTITGRTSLKKSPTLLFKTVSELDEQTLTLISRVSSLERSSKAKSNRLARAKCRLIRITYPHSVSFALECTVSWTSGESAFGPLAVKDRDMAILTACYEDPMERSTDRWSWTPQDFYDSVYSPPTDMIVPQCLNEKILQTDLYPFQKRAVAWMLERENPTCTVKHTSFKPVKDVLGRECLVSHLQGVVSSGTSIGQFSEPKGGILAEEMGLGKTCELIALLCLNPRPVPTESEQPQLQSGEKNRGLILSRATLIVTPQTILQQWKDELEKHAPHLSVLHYTGIRDVTKSEDDEQRVLRDFTSKDVVITSYSVLAKEVHFAVDPPERSFRHVEKRRERPRSPLVRMHWWRVCLDEAQMVESGVSAAARVASLLPRENAWAVSGTPLKKNIEDLFGLLVFLRYRPFCDSSAIWKRLVSRYKDAFKEVFGRIALRHSKDKIRDELRLPPQRRVVLTTPFTTIEEQNYKTLFEEMCQDVECATDGSPLHDDWQLRYVAEKMRSWLVRLRQTCLHPQVGGRNKRALGRGNAPLRTVAEVLEVMIEQNEAAVRSELRLMIAGLLLRAHIIANAKDDQMRAVKALEIYKSALEQAKANATECRVELAKLGGVDETLGTIDDLDDEDQRKTPEHVAKMKSRAALHSALQIQHACAFFVGTSYFQIKSNEAITKPDSERFTELEEQETSYYDAAKLIRRELLRENMNKAERMMKKVEDYKSFTVKETRLGTMGSGSGIENVRISSKAEDLADLLDAQAELINEWRSKVVELLLKPLVDEDEGVETTGDEYEESTKQQDTLYAYSDALRAIVADRNTCITGQSAPLVDHEMKVLIRDAKEEKGHAPKLLLELLSKCLKLKQKPDEVVSLRSLTHEARGLETSLQWQDGTNMRASAELAMVQGQLRSLGKIAGDETKTLVELEKALDLFRSTLNQRLEFYRQLQNISDTVAPYKEEADETLDTAALDSATESYEAKLRILAQLKTKHRFLIHLREESTSSEAERLCVICQCPFEQGVLTICGHQYCKECIQHWWKEHRTCPVCKRRLNTADFHDVTYKPQELRAEEEVQSNSAVSSPGRVETPSLRSSSIYAEISRETLAQIKSIDLNGSYGTKIDTLARHLLWMREHDAGAKSIVFSQYREFLDVLGTALKQFGIGFSRMGKAGAVNRFKQDASIEVFLLDAKTDSSGLNLVNAQHVFLAEPLINTAIELQAIARVHRIGQQRPTTVYMYLIGDTVEEAIYDISVTRRLAHMQNAGGRSGKSRSTTPMLGEAAIDAANSLEMQQTPLSKLLVQSKTGGEMVAQDDLWGCLFGRISARKTNVSHELQAEVGKHLRAEAAENRRLI